MTFDFISNEALTTIGLASGVMLVASLVVTPWVIVRLDPKYFQHEKPHLLARLRNASFARGAGIVLKNVAGLILLLAGILMLVLPGQGLLTILIGILLLDFPKKQALERRILAAPKVLGAVNWIRAKAKREPLAL